MTAILMVLNTIVALTARADSNWSPALGQQRNQYGLGACHTFTTIALVEAEYFQDFRQRREFSEAALFARSFFGEKREDATDRVAAIVAESLAADTTDTLFRRQSGAVENDFALLQSVGLGENPAVNYQRIENLVGELTDITLRALPFRNQLTADQILIKAKAISTRFINSHSKIFNEIYSAPRLSRLDAWLAKLKICEYPMAFFDSVSARNFVVTALTRKPIAVRVHDGIWRTGATTHSVVIVWYDQKRDELFIRNSWGTNLMGQYERIKSKTLLSAAVDFQQIEHQDRSCSESLIQSEIE
jgi:hypothetical protein